MTEGWKTRIARRPLLAGALGLLGLGVAGGFVYEAGRLFARRYPRTKYDDLLDQLPDRESASRLGRTAIVEIKAHGDVKALPDAKAAAHALRTGPGKGSIVQAMDADIAQGRLVEVHGWVLPLSLVMLALIAAEAR